MTPNSTPAPIYDEIPVDTSGLSVGAIAAIATGAVVVVALSVAAVVIIVMRTRRTRGAAAFTPGVVQAPPPGASHRSRCKDDGRCYRQNPAHWADFYHANQHAPVAKPVQGAAK
jgi:hypothetical protein